MSNNGNRAKGFSIDDYQIPLNEEGEQGLLSSIIHNPAILREGQLPITEDLFWVPQNLLVFKAVRGLSSSFDKEIDFPILKGSLSSSGELEEIGGKEYLSGLYEFVSRETAAEGWKRYFELAFESYRLRTAHN